MSPGELESITEPREILVPLDLLDGVVGILMSLNCQVTISEAEVLLKLRDIVKEAHKT